MDNVAELIKKSLEMLQVENRKVKLPLDLDEDIINFCELDSMDTLSLIANLEECSGKKINLNDLKKYNYVLSINSVSYALLSND